MEPMELPCSTPDTTTSPKARHTSLHNTLFSSDELDDLDELDEDDFDDDLDDDELDDLGDTPSGGAKVGPPAPSKGGGAADFAAALQAEADPLYEDDDEDDVDLDDDDEEGEYETRYLRLEIENPDAISEPEPGIIVARLAWYQKALDHHMLVVKTAIDPEREGKVADPREPFFFKGMARPELYREYRTSVQGFREETLDLINTLFEENPEMELDPGPGLVQSVKNVSKLMKLVKDAPGEVRQKVIELIGVEEFNSFIKQGFPEELDLEKIMDICYRGLMAIRLTKSGKEFYSVLGQLQEQESLIQFMNNIGSELEESLDLEMDLPDSLLDIREDDVDDLDIID